MRAKTTIGVDIGGTSVRAGVVDRYGNVLDTARAPTPASEGALEDAIVSAVGGLAARHRVDRASASPWPASSPRTAGR